MGTVKKMNVLVLGGTRFFGIHMVNVLLENGHDVTIATRGNASDPFGKKVRRITIERTNSDSMKEGLSGKHFDVVIDKLAYCSNDIKNAMEVIDADRYIQMSSTAVYNPKKINTTEDDFNGMERPVIWCNRADFPYDEIKRQAEYALWQKYSDKNWLVVRYPVVLGKDDYTNRLKFYVDHVINQHPMYIDNLDCQMSYIKSDEAGRFMAYMVDKKVAGAVNGASEGTISLGEILKYIEKRTKKRAILEADGDVAPYNGDPEFTINTDKAKSLGFLFTDIHDWIYDLLDYYIYET
jgi:nucleoside-diphosphate-sugar epimerase